MSSGSGVSARSQVSSAKPSSARVRACNSVFRAVSASRLGAFQRQVQALTDGLEQRPVRFAPDVGVLEANTVRRAASAGGRHTAQVLHGSRNAQAARTESRGKTIRAILRAG